MITGGRAIKNCHIKLGKKSPSILLITDFMTNYCQNADIGGARTVVFFLRGNGMNSMVDVHTICEGFTTASFSPRRKHLGRPRRKQMLPSWGEPHTRGGTGRTHNCRLLRHPLQLCLWRREWLYRAYCTPPNTNPLKFKFKPDHMCSSDHGLVYLTNRFIKSFHFLDACDRHIVQIRSDHSGWPILNLHRFLVVLRI